MSSYDDTMKISALHQEQSQVSQAIAVLDAGGTVTSFMVSPPPTQPGEMPSSLMSVGVSTVDPSEQLLQEARNQLVARFEAINSELTSLGVTDTPSSPEDVINRRRNPQNTSPGFMG